MAELPIDSFKAFERVLTGSDQSTHLLRLYVTGMTPKSAEAISNIKHVCEKHLTGRYRLEVIDIYQKPHMLKEDQVVAMPTLIRKLPLPLRRIIGNLSNTEHVLQGLDLIEKV
jgi:circadian clock protein KaiB